MRISVSRKESFNAVHRLYNSAWNDEQNATVFGKCANVNYHGHNYDLIVSVVGEPNADTGYVFDMKKLSDLIREKIISVFDHKNLNLDNSHFTNLIPTTEHFAVVIHQLLRPHISIDYDLYIKLYETERNFVEYPVR